MRVLMFGVFFLLCLQLISGPKISSYTIYCDQDAPESVQTAAKDLQKYIKRSTGCRLAIKRTPSDPMIAVGDNPVIRKNGIDPENMKYEEFMIRSFGDNIFLVGKDIPYDDTTEIGGNSFGSAYAVYEFLEQCFGIRWLIPMDERGIHIPPKNADFEPGRWNYCFRPFFRQRSLFADPEYRKLEYFKFNKHPGAFLVGSEFYGHCDHYWQYIYPAKNSAFSSIVKDREKTFQEHPEFFALKGKRTFPVGDHWSLCLSAPGITEDMAKRMVCIQDFYSQKVMCMSPNDGQPNCLCKDCQSQRSLLTREMVGELNRGYYRSWTPLVLKNYREIANILKKKVPGVPVTGFIYQAYEFAPHPKPEKFPDNFVAVMCPCWTAYGPTRLYEGVNRSWHKWIDDWNGVFHKKTYYGLDFWLNQGVGFPIPPFTAMMNDTFKTLKDTDYTGVQMYFNKAFGVSSASLWVLMKKMWNPDLDAEKLFDEFLICAYGMEAAPRIKNIYKCAEKNLANYVNSHKGKVGYAFTMDYLEQVCKPAFHVMEQEYIAASSLMKTPEQKWRMAIFGKNLMLLRYHLEKLNLIPEDPDSPLHMTDKEFTLFNLQRMSNGELHKLVPTPPITAYFPKALFPLSSVRKAEIPAKMQRRQQGNLVLQFHQNIIVKPEKNMTVCLTLEYVGRDGRKGQKIENMDIPYYCVYDSEKKLVYTGIAKDYKITFPAKKDEVLYVLYCPGTTSRSYALWRIASANTPFAYGQHLKDMGFYFWNPAGSSLYFMVPEKIKDFKIFLWGGRKDMDFIDSTGKKIRSVKGHGSNVLVFKESNPGWWRIDFHGGDYQYLRQDSSLPGFWVTDPANALDVRR